MSKLNFKPQLAKDVGATIADAVTKCQRPVLEPKYDGWRGIVVRDESSARLYNRSGLEYTGQVPELMAEFTALPVGTVLDGEIVAMQYDADENRWDMDFFTIHSVMRSKNLHPSRGKLSYVVFDVVQAGDTRTGDVNLSLRRDIARTIVDGLDSKRISLTVQVEATQAAHDDLVKLGFEGSVVKDASKPYAPGKRGHGWFKIKSVTTLDCVVTELPVDGKGQYEGQVGRMAMSQVHGGELALRCWTNAPNQAERLEMTQHPERYLGRVAEVKVYGFSDDGNPRHPTFLRWREDKPAQDCAWSVS